jgi:hypothetical protein
MMMFCRWTPPVILKGGGCDYGSRLSPFLFSSLPLSSSRLRIFLYTSSNTILVCIPSYFKDVCTLYYLYNNSVSYPPPTLEPLAPDAGSVLMDAQPGSTSLRPPCPDRARRGRPCPRRRAQSRRPARWSGYAPGWPTSGVGRTCPWGGGQIQDHRTTKENSGLDAHPLCSDHLMRTWAGSRPCWFLH